MGNFTDFAKDKIVLFDGGMGTSIQQYDIDSEVWSGKNGCNEYLNIAAPHIIEEIYQKFLEAGSDVIETNTFGATRLVLSEYGLEEMVYEINLEAATLARKAADRYHKFVAGSIGPGTKLPSLGHISYDELLKMYEEQVSALVDGKVDLIIIETCQDILQIKSAINAAKKVFTIKNVKLPIMVSVTVEPNGTMLTGSDLSAVATIVGSFDIYSIGINCALGPDMMYEHLNNLSNEWGKRISCIPNAGLPLNINGKFVYDMSPEKMAAIMADLLKQFPISIIGGCCGTTYEHIKALRKVADSVKPPAPDRFTKTGYASSIFSSAPLRQIPPPSLIGERANANGSKAFRTLLLNEDFDGMLKVVKEQEEEAAHLVDICVAYAGRNEKKDMAKFISMVNNAVFIPIVIDTTEPDVLEEALKRYTGKPVINSINFEDGGKKLHKVLNLVKDFPSAVIGLTIDEDGMAMTAQRKFDIAERIYKVWTEDYGYPPSELIIDPLTFSIGSGDQNLRYAAVETLDAIKMIKEKLKDVNTLLGVSNVSFGLSAQSRVVLNSVFLKKAVESGLDMAIVHASKILPIDEISKKEIELAEELIYGKDGALERFIDYFSDRHIEEIDTTVTLTDEEMIKLKLKKGDKTELENILTRLLDSRSPYDIINSILMPAMEEVGNLFGQGKMLLPFVLQSAEVMKKSVSFLEKFMEKDATEPKGKVVLATVKGDVHDIGKNLVEIILSNNGYKVYNLGIKVPVEDMIEKALEVKADAIGMSGLLVKSTLIMKENLDEMRRRGLNLKVLLGGAALTEGFVYNECKPVYSGEVYYCKDAFTAINYLEEKGNVSLEKKDKNSKTTLLADKKDKGSIKHDFSSTIVPPPPFWGIKKIDGIDFLEVERFLNKRTLFTNRWGYKKLKDHTDYEYDKILQDEVIPAYDRIKNGIIKHNLTQMKVKYGYFKTVSSKNTLVVLDEKENEITKIDFPRQEKEPYLCIADYFKSIDKGIIDVLPIQVVTLGEKPVEFLKHLKDENYKEYFLYHGFFTELTEALAEFWHKRIREELGIDNNESIEAMLNNRYRGLRYSFGYPSCPDLEGNLTIAELLNIKEIGIEITETYQMVPEFSTSAIIVHSDKAQYFII